MSGFKTLSQDLIDAAATILENSFDEACRACDLAAEECKCKEVKEDDMPDDKVFHKDGDENAPKKKELDENMAITPDDAVNAQGGLNERDSEMPKHVDIVKEDDCRPESAGGKRVEGYRALLQYSTNRRPEYVPSLDLPAAPTMEALAAMLPGDEQTVAALANSLNLPSNQDKFKGNDKK